MEVVMKFTLPFLFAAVVAVLTLVCPAIATGFVVGTIDTIGGTTYDFSNPCSGIQRMMYFDPDHGIHVAWIYSASTQTTFPDRNARYNFFDNNTGEWNWIDPDYMQSGINVFTERVGYGSIDLDPIRSVPVISCHYGSPITPMVARSIALGSETFEFCLGEPTLEGYLWPLCAVSAFGTVHLAMIDDASRDGLFHSRCPDWSTWSEPFDIPGSQPAPCFPNQHITASKQSGRVVIIWEHSGGSPGPGFYRLSTDDGVTWQPPVDIGWPPAFGGDTLTSFHIASFGSMFDRDDSLHIVAAVMPYIGGQGYVAPSEIWHFCPTNDPVWNRIHRADPDTIPYPVGYNTIFACRPKIGQDPATGRLYAAWSEFDSENFEPETELLRADIWASMSADNGLTWTPGVRLTGPDNASRVYFDLADIVNDTLHIVWQADLVAGAFVQAQGPPSFNPIVCMEVPVSAIGVEETEGRLSYRPQGLRIWPNPAANRVCFDVGLEGQREGKLKICDAAGRLVVNCDLSKAESGRRFSWNLRDSDGNRVKPGVYVARLEADRRSWTDKLIILR